MDFWFAVRRMARRGEEPPRNVSDFYPPPGDDNDRGGSADARVPRRPIPPAGPASATAAGDSELGELL